jgi:hypothetical protein
VVTGPLSSRRRSARAAELALGYQPSGQIRILWHAALGYGIPGYGGYL